MALSCIVIGLEADASSRVAGFLGKARFFEVKARFQKPELAVAEHVREPVHYFLVEQSLADETLQCLRALLAEERPRLIILGAEETYFLENVSPSPAVFGPEANFPSWEQHTMVGREKSQGLVGELQVPTRVAETFQIAKHSDKPVWILLKPGHWEFDAGARKPVSVSSNEALYVRVDGGIKRIRRSDLLLVEAERDYLVLTTAKERIRLLRSMKSVESKLDPDVHCRIHRSYIVNLKSIHTIDQEQIWLDGINTPIPIGPSYRKVLLEKLDII
jgi:hypothetical protein